MQALNTYRLAMFFADGLELVETDSYCWRQTWIYPTLGTATQCLVFSVVPGHQRFFEQTGQARYRSDGHHNEGRRGSQNDMVKDKDLPKTANLADSDEKKRSELHCDKRS